MSATPNSTLANPARLIADLQRQLAQCRADCDDALQREMATAEVLQAINTSSGDLAPRLRRDPSGLTRSLDAHD